MGTVVLGREHLSLVQVGEKPVCFGQGVTHAAGKDFSCLLIREFQSAGRSGARFYIIFPSGNGGIKQFGGIGEIHQAVHFLIIYPHVEMMVPKTRIRPRIHLSGRFGLELGRRRNNHVQRPSQGDPLQRMVVLNQPVSGQFQPEVLVKAKPDQGAPLRSKSGGRIVVQPSGNPEIVAVRGSPLNLSMQGDRIVVLRAAH